MQVSKERAIGSQSLPPGYRPQIDALRACAIVAVLFAHYWPALPSYAHEGVRLFFVISGFLITGILIECRDAIAGKPLSARMHQLRQFYARRFLRIFPAYYLLLVPLSLSRRCPLGASVWAHLTYTTNLWFAWTGSWEPWTTTHFWSLAIEEQFYLFWPMVVLWTPQRWLWLVVSVTIALGPLSRAFFLLIHTNEVARWTLTPASFDALGAGALLTLAVRTGAGRRATVWSGSISALLLFALNSGARLGLLTPTVWLTDVVGEALWVPVLALAVYLAASGLRGPLGIFLELAPLRFVGRISYGIYLYHLPAVLLLLSASDRIGLAPVDLGPRRLLLGGAASFLVATLSWYALEAPLNRLKRYFPYHAPG